MTPAAHWHRITSVLAIDPGARTGWALLIEPGGWHLADAGVISPTEPWESPVRPDLVVIETPIIRPNGEARPNDILTLARVVGRYEERFKAYRQEIVTPSQWKGTIDGDIFVKRIESALCAQDAALIATKKYAASYRHNMVDAIGMAYWALRQPFMRQPR